MFENLLYHMSENNICKAADSARFLQDGALELHHADGFAGWAAGAPYDCIHIGAAAPLVTSLQGVLSQLSPQGGSSSAQLDKMELLYYFRRV